MHGTDTGDLVRRYIEGVWNRGDLASLRALTSPNFEYRLGSQPARDREALSRFLTETREAFPDWSVEIDQIIAGPLAAAARWHGRVTHRGPFRGIPPTGRTIAVTGMNMYQIDQGKIAAEWEQTDSLGMLQQLGALPAPPA
jgi:steroid delta-isomerase-like uncharacterized protein